MPSNSTSTTLTDLVRFKLASDERNAGLKRLGPSSLTYGRGNLDHLKGANNPAAANRVQILRDVNAEGCCGVRKSALASCKKVEWTAAVLMEMLRFMAEHHYDPVKDNKALERLLLPRLNMVQYRANIQNHLLELIGTRLSSLCSRIVCHYNADHVLEYEPYTQHWLHNKWDGDITYRNVEAPSHQVASGSINEPGNGGASTSMHAPTSTTVVTQDAADQTRYLTAAISPTKMAPAAVTTSNVASDDHGNTPQASQHNWAQKPFPHVYVQNEDEKLATRKSYDITPEHTEPESEDEKGLDAFDVPAAFATIGESKQRKGKGKANAALNATGSSYDDATMDDKDGDYPPAPPSQLRNRKPRPLQHAPHAEPEDDDLEVYQQAERFPKHVVQLEAEREAAARNLEYLRSAYGREVGRLKAAANEYERESDAFEQLQDSKGNVEKHFDRGDKAHAKQLKALNKRGVKLDEGCEWVEDMQTQIEEAIERLRALTVESKKEKEAHWYRGGD